MVIVAAQIQNSEALRPAVAMQRKLDRKMQGWDCLLLTAKCAILAESAAENFTIPLELPPYIYHFLNRHNKTMLQTYCDLTY